MKAFMCGCVKKVKWEDVTREKIGNRVGDGRAKGCECQCNLNFQSKRKL